MGRTESLTWNRLRGEPWLVEQQQQQQQQQQQKLQRERNGALRTVQIGAPQKCLTLPTLLETRCFNNYAAFATGATQRPALYWSGGDLQSALFRLARRTR